MQHLRLCVRSRGQDEQENIYFFFFTLQSPNLALGLTLEWRSSSTLSADIVVSFSTTKTPLLSKECTVNVHHSDTFGLYKSRRCLLLLLAVFYRSTSSLMNLELLGELKRHQPKLYSFTQLIS